MKNKNKDKLLMETNDSKTPAEANVLSGDEKKTLDQCEKIIGKGLKSFHQVAEDFHTILEQKLFRVEYKSFKEYCEKKWNFTRGNGYKYAQAGQVLREMADAGAADLPNSVSAAMVLSDVSNPERLDLMKKSKETHGNTTAESLKKTKANSKPAKSTASNKSKVTPKPKKNESKAQNGNDDSEVAELNVPNNVIPLGSVRKGPEGMKSFKELIQMAQHAFDIAGDPKQINEQTNILSELKSQLKLRAQWEDSMNSKQNEKQKEKAMNTNSNQNDLSIEVPKKKNFHLPKGAYRARIDSVSNYQEPKAQDADPQYRFLFEVEVPGMTKTENIARKCYKKSLESGTQLRAMIDKLKGEEFLESLAGETLTLDCLEGQQVELILDHNAQNKAYEKPLVIVRDVFPPGTLELTNVPKAAANSNEAGQEQKQEVIAPQFDGSSPENKEAA